MYDMEGSTSAPYLLRSGRFHRVVCVFFVSHFVEIVIFYEVSLQSFYLFLKFWLYQRIVGLQFPMLRTGIVASALRSPFQILFLYTPDISFSESKIGIFISCCLFEKSMLHFLNIYKAKKQVNAF